ncbi:MAG TPA: hypothetical protein VFU21_32695 [Kofleriaceae bacterium]|nr:hypothetical protein [Kofleriaceae bacterium]
MTEFEEVPADSEQVLVAGPQGGHHFIVSARIRGLQPGDPESPGTIYNPSTRFTVWSEDGEQLDIDPPAYRLGYEEAGNGMFVLPGGHIIQVREEEVAALYGGRVKVRVEVEDSTGARASDERWVVPVEDTAIPQADAGPPPAWVEIGTVSDESSTAFEPLAAEGDVVRYMGPQGGHHFLLHARMMGLVPTGATTRFRVHDEAGDRVDFSGDVPLDYEDAGGGVYTLPYGPTTFLDDVQVTAGVRVRVVVELTDTDGIQVTDERWVRAVEP